MSTVVDFFNGRSSLKHINSTFLSLIPKSKEDASKGLPANIWTEYDLQFDFKDISDMFIYSHATTYFKKPSCFLRRKNDSWQYTIGWRIIVEFPTKGTPPRACISLGLTKAFDSIIWNSLQITMASMSFSRGLIKLLMQCVTSAFFSYVGGGWSNTSIPKWSRITERRSTLLIAFQHGTRDLFTWVSLGWQKWWHRYIYIYIIGGVKSPTHLLFRDDILYFTRANSKSIATIKWWFPISQHLLVFKLTQ